MKEWMFKKTGFAVLFLTLALAATAGQVIIDFKVPEYTPEGRLKTHLRGARAIVDAHGNADIEEVQLDTFSENGHNTHISAPHCRFSRQHGVVSSDSDVMLKTRRLRMTGTGFRWILDEDKGVIKSNVTVIITDSQGLYQLEP